MASVILFDVRKLASSVTSVFLPCPQECHPFYTIAELQNTFLPYFHLILLCGKKMIFVGEPSEADGSFHRKKDAFRVLSPNLLGGEIKSAGQRTFPEWWF